MPDAGAALRQVAALAATPRPAGGAAEAEARARCAEVLGGMGFSVSEEPVVFSGFPGRLATPVLGSAAAIAIVVASLRVAGGDPVGALTLLIATALILAVSAAWLGRRGVLDMPVMRERTTNLVAVRGTPRVWLMAHLDSKSQPVPIGARAAGIVGLGASWGLVAGLAVAELAGLEPQPLWPVAAAIAIAGAVPVALSVVGARSPGALDNATGVATVLAAADALPREMPVGVAITSGEELGLAGARAWVREAGRVPGIAINVDTIDDAGGLRVMYTRRRPVALCEAVAEAARRDGLEPRVGFLLPGILTDGVALADAGWQVVTVSRGTWGTLARVHTPADRAERLDGSGVARTAAVVATAARTITEG